MSPLLALHVGTRSLILCPFSGAVRKQMDLAGIPKVALAFAFFGELVGSLMLVAPLLSRRMGRPMGKADEYRQLAAECIYMAQEAGDAGCRVTLVDMANVLLRLADHHLDLISIRQRQAGGRPASAAPPNWVATTWGRGTRCAQAAPFKCAPGFREPRS
jgi:hypothetical protein